MGRFALRRTEGTPGLVAAGLVGAGLTAVFAATGALSPGEMPGSSYTPGEVVGVALMIIGVSTYLLVAWTIAHRRSLELVEKLRPQLPDERLADRALAAISSGWRRSWWIGTLVGVALGLLNTRPVWAIFESGYPTIIVTASMGQIVLWTIIGNLFMTRLAASNAFATLGEQVRFDVFRLDRLRPLARAGVVDAAVVMGALLFVPLQSLDFEFRWENYRFALAVALPAVAFYITWPLRTIHPRVRADRDHRLARVDAQLEQLGDTPPSTASETERLEQLLAHRDRLFEARTWPLDLRILSRIFIYLIIPPMAWAAAAVVERIVDAALTGG